MSKRFDSWKDFVPDPIMSDSKKIVEAFENLEVSITLAAESGENLGGMLEAHATEILVLENATTIPEIFEQLLKMRASGNIQKFIQAAKELTAVFKDTADETNRIRAVVEATLNETLAKFRELEKIVADLQKRIDEGDSWKREE